MANLTSVYNKKKGIDDPIKMDRNTILRIFLNIIPKVDTFVINSRIFAKESMNMPMMARDTNITRQNISKLVKFNGIKPSMKADSYFERAQKRESEYESMFAKESKNKKLQGPSVVGVSEYAQKAVDYGAVALGVAGFIGALAIAGNLINSIPGGVDGMKNMLVALAEGLSAFDLKTFTMFGALLAGGALFGKQAGIVDSIGGGLGIAAVGLGIGGFFAGLSVGGAIADFIGNSAGIKDMLTNLAEGLSAFDGDTFTQFSILLGAGALFGTIASISPGQGAMAAGGAMLGMGAIGAGLGLFFSGLSVGGAIGTALSSDPTMIKDLLVNVAEGLNAVASIEAMSLVPLIPILPLFGLSLANFLALQGIGGVIQTLGDGISKAINFIFGNKDQKSPLAKVLEDLKTFSVADAGITKVGQGFNDLMNGIKTFAKLSDEEMERAIRNGRLAIKLAEAMSKGKIILSDLPIKQKPQTNIIDERRLDLVSDTLVEHIKRTEGFTAKAKWDYKQYTNGYGTEAKSPDEVITEEEADRRLRLKLQETQDYVSSFLNKNGYTYNRGQLDALTSFTYNLGPGGLKLLTNNGTRSFDEIREKMSQYNMAGGKELAGLTKRRQQEIELFNGNATPITPTSSTGAKPSAITATPTTGSTVSTMSQDNIQQANLMNAVPPKVVINSKDSSSPKTPKKDDRIATTLDFTFADGVFGYPI